MLARASVLDPSNGEIAWRLGTAWIAARRPDDAVRELRRALGLLAATQQIPVRRDLAIAHFFQADYTACLRELEELDRLRPGSAEAHYWRARVFREQERLEKARAEVRLGLEADPEHVRLRKLAGELG